MMKIIALAIAIFCATALAVAAGPISGHAGKFTVELTCRPSPPVAGENLLVIRVKDGDKPLAGAGVDVHLDMTGMPMPADVKAAPGANAGEYDAPMNLAMAGTWTIDVRVRQMTGMEMAGDGTAHFLAETGKGLTTKGGAGDMPWHYIILGILLAAVIGTVLGYRRIPAQPRGYVVGVLTLLIVIAGTVTVVHKYRDPKTSTVLGSATMDMSAQGAPGAVAVVTETAHAAPFLASATYTATVAPDQEEDIYPRVTGRIIDLPLYPGDRVSAGQIVARLDTSELAAKEAQALHGSLGATQGVDAAGADIATARAMYAKAQKGVDQAEAQVAQVQSSARAADGAVKAAQSEVTNARQLSKEAESAVIAAQAGVEQANEAVVQAQSDVESTTADVGYWTTEIAREKKLYAQGAVAREELERETAQAAASQAKQNQAKAAVRTAQAGVQRAQQEVVQAQARQAAAQAAVTTAEARVEQALADRDGARQKIAEVQASKETAQADLRAAEAGITAATAKAGVARESAQTARAALTEARTVRGYTTIHAAVGGVVTARNIAAGTLVQPGMSLLKIAKTDVVRIQANVSSADLCQLHIGQALTAHAVETPGQPIAAQVTAIFPTRDTTARTAIVEARVANPGERLTPGQYLSVTFALGENQRPAFSAPTAALTVRDNAASLFVAVSDGVRQTAKVVAVTTGRASIDRTEIVSGLQDGDRVIISGLADLHDGDTVNVVHETAAPTPPLRAAVAPPPPPRLPVAGEMPGMTVTPVHHAPAKPVSAKRTTGQPTTQAKKWYHCPMHLDMESDKPGKCPKCGMDYVVFDKK